MDRIRKFEPLFGEWHAESLIGAGSFGRVYKIYREELGDRIYSALKHISVPQDKQEPDSLRDEGMNDTEITTYYSSIVYKLRDEIRLMSEMKGHTNIVSYEDSRIIAKSDGVGYDIFIRMELLENLRFYTRRCKLLVPDIVKLGEDICTALMVCEKNGIIHRDIKPDNLFVNKNGDFKVGDFGIARRLENTQTFMSKKGTYNYMAPEVYKGEKYGVSCDIYSLGIVMYYYLNNCRLPFMPQPPEMITRENREGALVRRMMGGEALPKPCTADEELSRIVLKACAYKPEDRYSSAEEMREDLMLYWRSVRGGYAAAAAKESVDEEVNMAVDEPQSMADDAQLWLNALSSKHEENHEKSSAEEAKSTSAETEGWESVNADYDRTEKTVSIRNFGSRFEPDTEKETVKPEAEKDSASLNEHQVRTEKVPVKHDAEKKPVGIGIPSAETIRKAQIRGNAVMAGFAVSITLIGALLLNFYIIYNLINPFLLTITALVGVAVIAVLALKPIEKSEDSRVNHALIIAGITMALGVMLYWAEGTYYQDRNHFIILASFFLLVFVSGLAVACITRVRAPEPDSVEKKALAMRAAMTAGIAVLFTLFLRIIFKYYGEASRQAPALLMFSALCLASVFMIMHEEISSQSNPGIGKQIAIAALTGLSVFAVIPCGISWLMLAFPIIVGIMAFTGIFIRADNRDK